MVKNWMSTILITVDAKASLSQAVDLMEKNHITFLPVLDNVKLVGTITDGDIKPFRSLCFSAAIPTSYAVIMDRVRVEDVMAKTPVTVPDDFTMEEVADVLWKNKIHGVPVVDRENKLAGVVTQTDIDRVFISLTGLWKGGIAFGFLLEDKPGSIKEVTDILRTYGGRLQSILSSYERIPKGYRQVQVRVRKLDRASLPELMEKLNQKGKVLYKIDHRENTRTVYSEEGS